MLNFFVKKYLDSPSSDIVPYYDFRMLIYDTMLKASNNIILRTLHPYAFRLISKIKRILNKIVVANKRNNGWSLGSISVTG